MKENEPYKIFPSEIAWLRRLNADNPHDIEMYKLIEAQSEVAKWMENEDMAIEEVKELLSNKDQVFYGICNNENQDKVDGWVSLYEPEKELINRLIEEKLIKSSKDTRILEISFARYIDPGLPAEEQKKGLVSSAVRQICFSLTEEQENIVIVGFTNPNNLPSENALKSSGFVIKGKVFYDKDSQEEDNFWILDKKELEKILKKKKAGL